MNLILGSGLIGLLAREILGPSYKIIPFGKSRFYSFNPSLADNFIKMNKDTIEVVDKLMPSIPRLYKRPFSLSGQLLYDKQAVIDLYLDKVHDNSVGVGNLLLDTTFMVHGVSCNALYSHLLLKYMGEIKDSISEGLSKPTRLAKDYAIFGGHKIAYDNIISTIPLTVLYKLFSLSPLLDSKTVTIVKINSNNGCFDFEGANQVLIADSMFSFYKVVEINKNQYVFFFHEEVNDYAQYISAFSENQLKVERILEFKEYIPADDPPDIKFLEDFNIWCVGSYAQWDDFMTVSASIRRIFQLLGKV